MTRRSKSNKHPGFPARGKPWRSDDKWSLHREPEPKTKRIRKKGGGIIEKSK